MKFLCHDRILVLTRTMYNINHRIIVQVEDEAHDAWIKKVMQVSPVVYNVPPKSANVSVENETNEEGNDEEVGLCRDENDHQIIDKAWSILDGEENGNSNSDMENDDEETAVEDSSLDEQIPIATPNEIKRSQNPQIEERKALRK